MTADDLQLDGFDVWAEFFDHLATSLHAHTAEVVDLMTRLRASLEGKREAASEPTPRRKTAGSATAGKKKTGARKRTGRAA